MRILTASVLAAALLAAACDSSSTGPTGPAMDTLRLTAAQISVDGETIGDSYQPRQGGAGSTRFEARLTSNGTLAPGHHVFAEVTPPPGMGGMGPMWSRHRFELWDDGTHGDLVAGDGIYCLEDFAGGHGFHHAGAHHGEYRYEFWGAHREDFSETNHMVHVVRVGS